MNKIRLILSVTAILLFFFAGCEKDIRDKYVGDWDFVTKEEYHKDRVIIGIDTIYYTGKISLGNDEHTLIIKYTEEDGINVLIDSEGNLYAPTTNSPSTPGSGPPSTGCFNGENKLYLKSDYYINNYEYSIHKYLDIIGTKKRKE
jgi:hypothetical protein